MDMECRSHGPPQECRHRASEAAPKRPTNGITCGAKVQDENYGLLCHFRVMEHGARRVSQSARAKPFDFERVLHRFRGMVEGMGEKRVVRQVGFPFPVHSEKMMRLTSFWEESRSWTRSERMAAYRRKSRWAHGVVGSVSWTREMGLSLSFRNRAMRSEYER